VNLAFVLSYFAEQYGGPVAVVRNLGPALADRGHEVSYWATTSGAGRSEAPAHAHLYPVTWPRAWYRAPELAQGLEAAVSSIDVLHLSEMWLYAPWAAGRLARRHQVPYVLSPAGSLEPWALRRGRLRRLKKAAYLRLLGNPVLRGAACLRACSLQEAEHLRLMGYEGPITIIPNGVDIRALGEAEAGEAEAFWPDLRGRPVVVFMSRLSPEKGLDLLIPAWSQLTRAPAGKEAVLVIAGPDYRGYRKTVEALLARHGLQRHVLLPGMVQGRRKAALLRRADVFVLPSHSENFGIVVAEALACGTPVVTTTATPWEVLRQVDAGRWVAPEVPELRQALGELLALTPSQRTAMGRRGSELAASRYTWEAIAGQFVYLCHQVAEGKPVPLYPPAARPGAGESPGRAALVPSAMKS
jgi:glycosyltransferase involved in cell wall biosynthesis